MLGWLRKILAPPEAEKKKLPKSSLFSTDTDLREVDYGPFFNDIIAKSIQKSASDFKPMNADGTAAVFTRPAATFAMDGFAMDAPSDGNPLALKPILEPPDQIPFTQLVWYALKGFIGYQICAIIAQHWMVDKICLMPARDAVRRGWEITFNDGEEVDKKEIQKIKKADKKYKLRKNLIEAVKFNRVFGIRIIMFVVETNDQNFYLNPFNIDGVKPGSYRGISQIDPYWITPELDFQSGANPAAIDFYEPTWWRVNGKRIHKSHLIVLRNGEVADVLKPSYLYGGISVPQKISERIYAAERTANEAPMLAMTKRSTIWKMDITQAIANAKVFAQKMGWFAQTRDNYGVKAVGLDDEIEQLDTALTDFNETIMAQYEIACAIGECPVTKIMGSSPKGGLGANGDYEMASYHEFLESIQEHDMSPIVERHYLILNKSDFDAKLPEIEVSWNPCRSPTPKEQAEINLAKAQTGQQLVTSGAIDGIDERARIIADPDSGYNGLADRVPEQPGDENDEGGGEVDE